MVFKVDIKDQKSSLLFLLKGKLVNEEDATLLNQKVDHEIQAGRHQLIFDLSALEQCNSSGLNVLIRTLTKARTAQGDLILCSLNEALQKIFTITKINEIFSIYATLEDANKHFK
ncbi:MAG: STAS domain-containing protein [Crocinitomicaceae bacterium]